MTDTDVQALAQRIRDEIAWAGPGPRSWLGHQLSELVADPVGRWWHRTAGRVNYEQRLQVQRTSHEARMLVLKLADRTNQEGIPS
jgi:hypothetical protein